MSPTKSPRHIKHILLGLILFAFLPAVGVRAAQTSTIWFQTASGQFKIPSTEKNGRISVDILRLAECLGAGTNTSNGIYVMQFSSETLKINPATNIFSIKSAQTGKWNHVHLRDKGQVIDGRLFITLESLPVLLNQSFRYHLQRHQLSVGSGPKPTEVKGYKNLPARYVFRDQKIWISVHDMAKALGLQVYSYQAGNYSLIFPDFMILELNVGQRTVIRLNQPYKQLSDPVLSFGGLPYVTLDSVSTLFETDARWDSNSKTVLVPMEYGRLRTVQVDEVPRLVVIGYRPEPFDFKIDQFSAYYQEPDPTYLAANNSPYDSVRDYLTGETINKKSGGLDQVNANGLAELKGSLFGAPFEGQGSFEKLGGDSHVVNASAKWGFPVLQIAGGREYMTFNGLTNQFQLVDQVTLSHSNDAYGEGEVNPNMQVKAGYGSLDFNVFSSTELFTQTAVIRQQIASAGVETGWRLSPTQQVSTKLDYYYFFNKLKGVESSFTDPDLIELLKEIGESIDVDPVDEVALVQRAVSDHHSVGTLDVDYSIKNMLELQGIASLSHYNELDGEQEFERNDTDWKARAVVGDQKNRLEGSFERVGPRYRSVGNPFSYQAKKIARFLPYFTLTRWWRLMGELRREDTGQIAGQSIPAYTTKYYSGSNIFNFRYQVFRLSFNDFDSTLFGKRINSNLDMTQYIGANSIDLGGGGTIQYDSFGTLYRRSYAGRASFRLSRNAWKYSMGEELTKHYYVTLENLTKYESVSSVAYDYKGFRSLFQYKIEPRYYTDPGYVYTGYARGGYEVGDKKYLDFFYSCTSKEQSLKHPEVFRVGFEFTTSIF